MNRGECIISEPGMGQFANRRGRNGFLLLAILLIAAIATLTTAAGGACKTVKATPPLSAEDGMAAMKMAGTSGYKPATAR